MANTCIKNQGVTILEQELELNETFHKIFQSLEKKTDDYLEQIEKVKIVRKEIQKKKRASSKLENHLQKYEHLCYKI